MNTTLRDKNGNPIYPTTEGGGGGGSSVINKYGGLSASGTLANGQKIETPIVHVVKNCLLSACIEGTIDSNGVEVGVGKGELDFNDQTSYGNSFMITSTSVIYGELAYPHGLTLDSLTYVDLQTTTTLNAEATLTITNGYGDTYTHTFAWRVYVGKAFIKNTCANSINARLAYYMKDINQPVWVFGDSYLSYLDSARWTYYCKQASYTNWLLNAIGGQSAEGGLTDLKNILNNTQTYPSVILWTYGMNGAGDSNGQVNSNWMAATNELIGICASNGIELVFTTIPSLPNVSNHTKTALNNWVRNSGYRYVDMAKAMGDDDPSGNCRGWGTDKALLNKKANGDPDVHPTARGAIELFRQVLIDFPEISIGL